MVMVGECRVLKTILMIALVYTERIAIGLQKYATGCAVLSAVRFCHLFLGSMAAELPAHQSAEF